jgi:hypothetical protein
VLGETVGALGEEPAEPSAHQPTALPLLDGIVDFWVEPLAALAVAQGRAEAEARAEARLGVAVTRGLLLDLLATGDREAVDAAVERYIAALAPADEGRG